MLLLFLALHPPLQALFVSVMAALCRFPWDALRGPQAPRLIAAVAAADFAGGLEVVAVTV